MKTAISTILLLLLIASSAYAQDNALVGIFTPQGRGTGFAVHKTSEKFTSEGEEFYVGYVMTAYHVVAGNDKIAVKWPIKRDGKNMMTQASVVVHNSHADVAVLETIIPVECKPFKLADSFESYDKVDFDLQRGKKSGPISEARTSKWRMGISVSAQPGDSGSPGLNEEKEVVAMLLAGLMGNYQTSEGEILWPIYCASCHTLNKYLQQAIESTN
jgi:S1-C subfamily serine protease